MISVHARDSFDRIFRKAAQSRLLLESGDLCDIAPLEQGGASPLAEANVVVLTISSIAFRLLLTLHFNEDVSTRDYFVKAASERSFQETFLEICNLCCGAMNQELLRYFPDLGMSTPYVLSAHCVPYLAALKPDFLSSYAVTLNGSVQLAATLCVCADAPIDFVADVSAVEESCGELELF